MSGMESRKSNLASFKNLKKIKLFKRKKCTLASPSTKIKYNYLQMHQNHESEFFVFLQIQNNRSEFLMVEVELYILTKQIPNDRS